MNCFVHTCIGTPIYNLFTNSVIPIQRRPWSLSRRLRRVNRIKRRARLRYKKRKPRRERGKRRKREKRTSERSQADEPPSKKLRPRAPSPPTTTTVSEEQPLDTCTSILPEGIHVHAIMCSLSCILMQNGDIAVVVSLLTFSSKVGVIPMETSQQTLMIKDGKESQEIATSNGMYIHETTVLLHLPMTCSVYSKSPHNKRHFLHGS